MKDEYLEKYKKSKNLEINEKFHNNKKLIYDLLQRMKEMHEF